jgi:hypothetical protein
MLPAVCQVYVSSPGPLRRQKLPDVDGVAAKLETFWTPPVWVSRENENR